MAEGATRMLAGICRRAQAGDVDALAYLVNIQATLSDYTTHAARALNGAHGYSWADLGRRLGITRQAAQQRWGGE